MDENDLRIDIYSQAGGRYNWSMRIVHIPSGIVAQSDSIPGRGPGQRTQFSVKTELLGQIRRRLDAESTDS